MTRRRAADLTLAEMRMELESVADVLTPWQTFVLYLQARGWTQREIGEQVGSSQFAISEAKRNGIRKLQEALCVESS